MNAEFARTAGTSSAPSQTTSAAPMSEFLRWNDMAVTPSRSLPPVNMVQLVEPPPGPHD